MFCIFEQSEFIDELFLLGQFIFISVVSCLYKHY